MFADADYAVAPNGPRFASVVAVVLGDTAIIWKIINRNMSRLQRVRLSTAPFKMRQNLRYSRERFLFFCSRNWPGCVLTYL